MRRNHYRSTEAEREHCERVLGTPREKGLLPALRRVNPDATKTAYEAMAWSQDSLVREIYSEIDDRELSEIAESIYEIYFGREDEEDPMRQFVEPRATSHLTHDEAVDATTLASHIVDWANYGVSYGDFGDPPWEREENPHAGVHRVNRAPAASPPFEVVVREEGQKPRRRKFEDEAEAVKFFEAESREKVPGKDVDLWRRGMIWRSFPQYANPRQSRLLDSVERDVDLRSRSNHRHKRTKNPSYRMRNLVTGEYAPVSIIGNDEYGDTIYLWVEGWEPVDSAGVPVPYWLDQDGNWHVDSANPRQRTKNPFMVPRYAKGTAWNVETNEGDFLVLSDIYPTDDYKVGDVVEAKDVLDALYSYVEGIPESAEVVEGYFAHLTAPGYLDQTEWAGPFDNEMEAQKYIVDTFDVDPITGENILLPGEEL